MPIPSSARPAPSTATRSRPRPGRYPLYDPAFDHDACGVGFVADLHGRARQRVLPLALAGLAALAHRGAYAADGASSDGAGVSLPLEPDFMRRILPGVADGQPGVVMAFVPAHRGARSARRLIVGALADEGLEIGGWRDVPVEPAALGASAAAGRPAIVQAAVLRPAGQPGPAFELHLANARRRAEAAARAVGVDLSIASASARTIVYKGLVAGARLGEFYPDLRPGVAVGYALFHQRYATNTHPSWRLAQPFRFLAHNGEINTIRANRVHVHGRTGDPATSRAARAILAAGPLVSTGGSDSLSLDEAVELLVLTGWTTEAALAGLIPAAGSFRVRRGSPARDGSVRSENTAGSHSPSALLAPWDGPAAIVFADGRRVGALVDRNGLRPAAYAYTADGLVTVASEAGAIPISPAETTHRGRLGPGDMLLVEPGRGRVFEDGRAHAEASAPSAVRAPAHGRRVVDPARLDLPPGGAATTLPLRALAGLDAERARLDIRTMALDGHEPLWSMGDDTPTPALGKLDRPVADHLRQAFAQVTNPPIDPDRERAVLDLSVEVGRRASLLGGRPTSLLTVRVGRPVVADPGPLIDGFGEGRVRRLDATWDPAAGPGGLEAALERLGRSARVVPGRVELIVLSDRCLSIGRLPIPSVLAAGAVHAALTAAGRRGRTDLLVEAADVLDVHALAMAVAAGASVVVPWLAVELAAELAGGRGAEALTAADAVRNLLGAFEAGLRKTLARMGISTIASYVGGGLVESLELAPAVVERCLPGVPAWPGSVGFAELADRQLRRVAATEALAARGDAARLADPGHARFRADGERHLYAPAVVKEIQALGDAPGAAADGTDHSLDVALERYRGALKRPPATVRDQLAVRRAEPVPLDEVEPEEAIARRFVASAMSVGALSPEAHRAVTIGMQRAGGAANTGEGGEDPARYVAGLDGERQDARIKQVASARFGVTAEYLARAEQLEIKMAQGSKPGEGGHLPGRKATVYIAALRRAQPGQSLISPPPHHDIYSIEDLAQLIADLRAVNPAARIGVKLVATRGVGTIAAGVAKAGADYVHLAGHAGGTGASPLSSIKHVGSPWELGLAEVHQTLLANDLRDRIAVRVDGGLQTGRDLLIAALLGAEEFGFGTALLVALGCDMARQCHLDTCPTGIATQRDDLRAAFAGTPEHVERFVRAVAADLRRELAAIGARSVGEIVGAARRHLRPAAGVPTVDLRALLAAPDWPAGVARRSAPARAGVDIARQLASPTEHVLVERLRAGADPTIDGDTLAIVNADRSFGAELAGAHARGDLGALDGPLELRLRGSAGQSFGAFLPAGFTVHLTGQANDGLGKGLSGGTILVSPEPELRSGGPDATIAGNACLYGATSGRAHLVGAVGMRFAVRNSGARAVVEALGAHGCEYMTGGTVVVLGRIGPNFGAGMTGGRAFLHDPDGRSLGALHGPSVRAERLATVAGEREDGPALVAELVELLEGQLEAGSAAAAGLLAGARVPLEAFWLVEPIPGEVALPVTVTVRPTAGVAVGSATISETTSAGHHPQPVRNHPASGLAPTPAGPGRTVD